MAHSGIQPYRAGGVGRRADAQWALRPALYVRDVRDDPFLHDDGDRRIRAAAQAAGHPPFVPLHRVSLTTGDLCFDQRRVDAEYDHHAAYAGAGGDNHRALGGAGIFVLEAE